MAPVILYLDLMSQPSRAVLLFCRVNGVDVEVQLVNLSKGEQHRPEYRDVNPLAKVPAINDSGFRLQESHAILRYLAAAKTTASHWYPPDVTRRALVDSVLDWHHNNLRRGSAYTMPLNLRSRHVVCNSQLLILGHFRWAAAGLILHKVLAPSLGIPLDAKMAEDSRKQLLSALSTMEQVWITEQAPFLGGLTQPSIADLSLACEITQLKLLGAEEEAALLEPFPHVRSWLSSIRMWTAPHFGEVHKILVRAAAVAERRREKVANT